VSEFKKAAPPRRNPEVNAPTPEPIDPRQDRAGKIDKSRRRRRDSSYFDGHDFQLLVPESEKDHEYVYRWINDDKYRLSHMTKHDDWDICTVEEFSHDFKNTNDGTQISRIVGKDSSGTPLRAFLCKKLKIYDEEDRARELENLDQLYRQMREGEIPGGDSISRENPNLRYVPLQAR
jgi:hypothetical protein